MPIHAQVVNQVKKYNFNLKLQIRFARRTGADLGEGCRGCAPPSPEMTCGFLIQMVFCKKKKTMWFIAVEVEQETSVPPPKKNPRSAPDVGQQLKRVLKKLEKLATIESELSEISAKHVEER